GGVDAASNGPQPCNGVLDCERVVFVTSQIWYGNLGGLAGGDAKCQALANASPLSRVNGHAFRAWLSTQQAPAPINAADRIPHGTKPYVLVDGTPIAADWASLTDGSLSAPISLDEKGALPFVTAVWTCSTAAGAATAQGDCQAWTYNGPTLARGGDALQT